MSSFRPRTATARLGVPALDERLAAWQTSRTIPGNLGCGVRHHVGDEAKLLGLEDYDHDAVRIIMAARVRLRLLRMMRQTPEVRDNVRRVARARDVLLQNVVELYPHPARQFPVEKALRGVAAIAGGREST
jgi:hypothetical protein